MQKGYPQLAYEAFAQRMGTLEYAPWARLSVQEQAAWEVAILAVLRTLKTKTLGDVVATLGALR